MLKIFFGDNPGDNYIFNPDVFFNNTYEDEWITSETSRKMIKDIDGSEVKGPCMIDSPFLGPIPPERLSGGVKTLILMQNDPDHIFNASACGNNCAQWILKLAEQKDICYADDVPLIIDSKYNLSFAIISIGTDRFQKRVR